MLPKLFLGSSANHLDTARALKEVLSDVADVTTWDEPGAGFEFNESVFGGLLAATEKFDFAVFVFEADDIANIRRHGSEAVESRVVRDNVVFEFGLFVGSIGRSRAYWISPKGAASPVLPTDLAGLFHVTFSFEGPKDAEGHKDANGLGSALRVATADLTDRIRSLGPRTDRALEEIPNVRVLCASSSEYDAPQFEEDREEIRRNFAEASVCAKEGISARELYALMSENRWHIVHLATYVDVKTGDVILPDSHAPDAKRNRLLIKGVVDLVRNCQARLVVVPTCDSIALAIELASVTNVIAGHKPVEQVAALSWAKVFYQNLSRGVPLSESYDAAQRQVDCGLALLSRRGFRLI